MTVTGQLLGSPAYMAPEHVEGRQLDFRTDVFAAGIVLYQLTVGKLPFEGKNPHEILKRIAECKFADPRQANPRIGNRARQDHPAQGDGRRARGRYPTMAAMVADLEGYLTGSGLGTPKDELARYFAGAGGLRAGAGAAAGRSPGAPGQGRAADRRALALDLIDRVLTIDGEHEGARALLTRRQPPAQAARIAWSRAATSKHQRLRRWPRSPWSSRRRAPRSGWAMAPGSTWPSGSPSR
jgi:serine/threonine protein kinase